MHEAINIWAPVDKPDKSKPLWGRNQWPEVPAFKVTYSAWFQKMSELGLMVMEA